MIRTMIVDDDGLVRLALADILQDAPGITVAALASDGREAIQRATAQRLDVVLMDVRMPHMDGLEATRQLLALPHPPKVVMLTTFDLDQYVYDGLAAGAVGFLLKDTDPDRSSRPSRSSPTDTRCCTLSLPDGSSNTITTRQAAPRPPPGAGSSA